MADPEASQAEETDRSIGAALRALREDRSMTARQLATAADISAAMISRIESGQVSPSIATLSALARALGAPLVSLFHETDTGYADITVVRSGEGLRSMRMAGDHIHEFVNLAARRRKDLQFEAHLITLERQQAPPPVYVGRGVVLIYALKGSARFRYGQQDIIIEAGDTLSFDAELGYGIKQVIGERFSFLNVQAEPRR